VIEALATSGAERGYPASIGSNRLLDAAVGWISRRFGVEIERRMVAACIGTKELVAGVPQWLHLRRPDRDTVLYPAISYPTYEMGAILAGCRAVPVAARPDGTMDLDAIEGNDAERALCLWLNSPSNPTGDLDDLEAAVVWGRARGVPVFSDECYAEFTWQGRPRTILEHGLEGLVAVHSISKRSNCAGLRLGFYAGDPDLVHYLVEVRRHAGFMVPGPIQLAGAVALEDDVHVEEQRQRYFGRLELLVDALAQAGIKAAVSGGSFYLWVPAPDDERSAERLAGEGPEWGFTRYFARAAGMLVSPGEFYGPAGEGSVRIAVVQPDDRIELACRRLLGAAD
jgi:aspartate/methionine/tyrosine aminotransferase